MAEEAIDVAVDTNTDVEEATNSNENSEQEDTVDLAEELEKQRKANSHINARAKKAEVELKELKEAQAKNPLNNTQEFSQSDLIVISREGLSDEEIEKATIIAKGSNLTFKEAIKDPLFLSYQATLKEKERKEKAKLGASKGSGESQDETLIKQGMTRDEHMEAFKKVMG